MSPANPEPLVSLGGNLRSQLDGNIETIEDNLKEFGGAGSDASDPLATLGAEYSSFWQGPDLREMARELRIDGKRFLTFPIEQTALFTESS